MTQEKSRLQWLDVAKGYGIFLVIMGHFSAPVLQVPLYSFHMPLFFFLSGYVFSIKSGLREFVSGKMMRIVLPYDSHQVQVPRRFGVEEATPTSLRCLCRSRSGSSR